MRLQEKPATSPSFHWTVGEMPRRPTTEPMRKGTVRGQLATASGHVEAIRQRDPLSLFFLFEFAENQWIKNAQSKERTKEEDCRVKRRQWSRSFYDHSQGI